MSKVRTHNNIYFNLVIINQTILHVSLSSIRKFLYNCNTIFHTLSQLSYIYVSRKEAQPMYMGSKQKIHQINQGKKSNKLEKEKYVRAAIKSYKVFSSKSFKVQDQN